MDELIKEVDTTFRRLAERANQTEEFVKAIKKTSNWKNPNLYKTALCDYWRNGRKCKYGSKCWYAHGPHELQNSSVAGGSIVATDKHWHGHQELQFTTNSGGGDSGMLTDEYWYLQDTQELYTSNSDVNQQSFDTGNSSPNDGHNQFSKPIGVEKAGVGGCSSGADEEKIIGAKMEQLEPTKTQTRQIWNLGKSFRPFGDSYPLKEIVDFF